ncbi:MAG: cytochrome c [Draconibacterium sp.]|nr:cytochrome c [Draconibacterium sp.]
MIKKLNLLFVLVLFLSAQGIGQEWLVPEDKVNIENPSEYNLENVKKGKEIYFQNCKSCHGDAGKNNALPLVPPPPDVVSDVMHANTEGELFYKITVGRGGMPQFETTISEDDRWRLVNYIMNYNPNNTPVLVEAPPVKAKLMASVNETQKTVEVFAEYESSEGVFTKLVEAPVTISAKKAFGEIPVGQVLTNDEGRAEFKIPETVIGDEQGMVSIVVSLEENYETDAVILEASKVGQQKEVPKLITEEVLWSTNENVQSWLLLTYLGAAGAAWLAIVYVVFQLIKIKRLSKD